MLRTTMVMSCVAVLGTAGCTLDPQNYETPPVEVETSKGIVTCQLYTPERVIWDRAIDRPETMGVQEADDVCRAEGQRIIGGS